MAAVKVYVSLCLLVLCTCRPTENELPHSRDFYAGYIKALNDNFDVLFKPERQTRSISSSEEKESDAAEENRAKVLDELIDKNPQKRDDTEGMDMHKRDLRNDDITNAKILSELTAKTNTEASNSATINNDQISEIQKKSSINIESNSDNIKTVNSTIKSEVSPIKSEVSPIKSEVSPIKSDVSPIKSEVSPIKSEVSPIKSEVPPKDEEESEVTSGDKKTIDNNLDSENISEDNASGEKKSIESISEEGTSGSREATSEELTSGDTETSATISDEEASGSRRSGVTTYATQVKGEIDFEEKRETRNIADDNSKFDVTSGDKRTLDINSEDVTSATSADEEDDDASGDVSAKRGTIKAQKKNISDIENIKNPVKENENMKNETIVAKRSNVKDSNSTTVTDHTYEDAIYANNDGEAEINKHQFETAKKKSTVNKNVLSKHKESEEIPRSNIEENIDDDEFEEDNDDDKLPVKKAIVNEDDVGDADSKDEDDIDLQKKTVLFAADDATNQINKKTVQMDEEDDDEQRKKTSYHVVIASKKTVVPVRNNTNVSTVTNTSDFQREKKRKKHHERYTPQIEETESSNKRVTEDEEEVVLPDAFTSDNDDDDDKALINAPEPTYVSQIPGLEMSTIERFSDEHQEAARERGLSDRSSYQNPLMFYRRTPNPYENPLDRNDFENMRRHFILEHASMQHLPYMPGIMSGYTENQGERNMMNSMRHVMGPENNIPSANINGNMLPQEGSVINEQYSSGLPPSNQEVVSFRQNPYYQQQQQNYQQNYPQQNSFSPSMEPIQYEDRYPHGLAESNTEGYVPQSAAEVPANARSLVMDKGQRESNDDDSLIKVPSTIVDRFIQNAASIYEFGDELVRHSPALMGNARNGIPRSAVVTREKGHEPVILQPIVVLMPYSASK